MIDAGLDKINKFVPEKWRWVLEHSGFRKYFKNTGWMFFGQMFSLLVSFFIGAWIARYLGPSNYGVLSYALSFGGILGFFVYLTADNILSRELIKYPERRDSLLGTSFILRLAGGFIALILTVVAAFIFEGNVLTRSLILIYSFSFLLPAFGVVGIYFQANVLAKKTVKAQMVAMIISSILKIAVIIFGFGVFWIMVVYVLDSLWSSATLWLVYHQNGFRLRAWSFDKGLARSLFKDSVFLMLSIAVGFIFIKIDQVIIGNIMSKKEVGLYAVAVKISEIWNFIPAIICTSLFPAIVNAKIKGERFYYSRLRSLYWLLGSLATLLAIPITTFSAPIIVFLFGDSYLVAAPILQVYIWSGIGLFLYIGVNQYMAAENMVKTAFFLSLLVVVTNVVLNLVLIPVYGLIGAALASVISYLIMPLIIFFFGNILKKKIH